MPLRPPGPPRTPAGHSAGEDSDITDYRSACTLETPEQAKGSTPIHSADTFQLSCAAQSEDGAGDARRFEDLTIDEFLTLLLRSPRATMRRLKSAASSAAVQPQNYLAPAETVPVHSDRPQWPLLELRTRYKDMLAARYIRLYSYALAIVLAFLGSVIARGTPEIPRTDEYSLHLAAPYLWLAILFWLAAEIIGRQPQIKAFWRSCESIERWRWTARAAPAFILLIAVFGIAQSMGAPLEDAGSMLQNAFLQFMSGLTIWLFIEFVFRLAKRRLYHKQTRELGSQPPPASQPAIVQRQTSDLPLLRRFKRGRVLVMILAVLCSAFVWANSGGNRIEWATIRVWLLSIALWSFAFAPARWNLLDWATNVIECWRRANWRSHWRIVLAFVLIMLLGFNLRFASLESSPPQLIGDHVENIRDAMRMRFDNYSPIRFTDYNSRDPLHYYLLVALNHLTGLEISRFAFSLLSAVEGMITLVMLFLLGREIMSLKRHKFADVYGLLVMALAAVSFWHVTMSRQGHRITLCPLFIASSLIFYARALRHNRQVDYVKAGLLLGLGLLSYQAVQMLPVVYVAGLVLALLVQRLHWRERLSYLANLALLALIAIIVFLPQLRFWVDYPDIALVRQIHGIYGTEPGSDFLGIAYLGENIPTLLGNLRRNLLTFSFQGESVWIAGMHNEPLADPLTAGLSLLGLAAWLVAVVKTRDVVIALIPIALVLMLLVPSFAIARPIESQHNMRASGALTPAFLIAGLPLAIFCWQICQTLPKRAGPLVALAIAAGAILYTYSYNHETYFVRYTDYYHARAQPYREAGHVLRGFAESDGSYGNAFIILSPHWWDARAVGIEGGNPWFENGAWAKDIPSFMRQALSRTNELQLDPNRDLLFFYSKNNQEAPKVLSNWFPQGRPLRHELRLESKSFYTYRVPALGREAMHEFLEANT